jgi:hypothetical protein
VKQCFFVNEKNKNQEDDIAIVASDDYNFQEYIEALIDITAVTDVPRKALHILQNMIECKKNSSVL